jgi:TolB-like protein/DNA-binding winged helix-turn-helix (wHTH) protein/tetratricopeptide (TPR) repeat protein
LARFGPFELEMGGGDLCRHGRSVPLPPQPLKVLDLLIRNAGRTVPREELQRHLWGSDTFVDAEHGLNTCIRQIRAALGDDPDAPHYIETVPRRGYRFVAPLIESPTAPPAPSPAPAPLSASRWTALRSRAFLATAGTLLAAALILTFAWRKDPSARIEAATNPIRLAILPFENLSGDSGQEYFSDGLTDEMIATAGRLRPDRLAVIARTSVMRYKGNRKPIAEIAQELGVQYVLEGTVRRQGNHVRINAQLIGPGNETPLWSETFDRRLTDLLELQSEIAGRVAGSLAIEILHPVRKQNGTGYTRNPAAYDAYIKGRHFWRARSSASVGKGLEYFREAARLDPAFAAAHLGVAQSYIVGNGSYLGVSEAEAFEQAGRALGEALRLDETLAEAHAVLGAIHRHAWKWAEAEAEFRRALELDPANAMVRAWYAEFLSLMGRHEEALAQGHFARDLDPLSPIINLSLGVRYYFARRYDEAVRHLQAALELDPGLAQAYFHLRRVYFQQNLPDAYSHALAQELVLSGVPQDEVEVMRRAYRKSGLLGMVRWKLARWERLSAQYRWVRFHIATHYAQLGQFDEAFASLEKAMADRSDEMVWLAVDPALDPMRGDPRFPRLLQQMNLRP